ncbi:MAG: hypothetical protein NVSMB6_26280 [Burkholderiaceae bacterium]
MYMSPPVGGDTFVGLSGLTITSSANPIEVGQGDVRQALQRNWAPHPDSQETTPGGSPRWYHVGNGLTYTDFSAAALTVNIPLFLLPPHAIIQGIKIKHSVAFAGPAITAYTVSVGDVGNRALYASAFNVFQAPGSTIYQLSQNFAGEDALVATQISATATAVGANLSAATAGSVDTWALLSQDIS